MCPSLHNRRAFLRALSGSAAPLVFAAADVARTLNSVEAETFLNEGKMVNRRTIGIGITQSVRVTLSYQGLQYYAHVQSVDEYKPINQTATGTEMNFRDCWQFNIAAYRLDRMLDMNMIPPAVARKLAGKPSAFSWWIPAAMMEGERLRKKLTPPDVMLFNRQMYAVRVFDQLLQNTDRNLQNLVITPDWNLWMIDHTRCFRLRKEIATPKNLVQCDRRLLRNLKSLERKVVVERMEDYLRPGEVDAMMKRRDLIVRHFEQKVAAEGEARVLYDLPARVASFKVVPAAARATKT